MLGEAARLKIIPESPWIRVKSFQPDEHPKGILMMAEAAQLLNPAAIAKVWKGNQLYHAANLTASLTGHRVGERPCTANRIEDALKAVLAEIGIKEPERVERNITFHSWRAFANTCFQGRGISREKVQEITRHATKKMTEHYSDFHLEHFRDVADAQEALVATFTESGGKT